MGQQASAGPNYLSRLQALLCSRFMCATLFSGYLTQSWKLCPPREDYACLLGPFASLAAGNWPPDGLATTPGRECAPELPGPLCLVCSFGVLAARACRYLSPN